VSKLTSPILVLAALAALVAGCGSSGSSSSSGSGGGSNSGVPSGGGGVNGISVGNCLNAEDFLVQPSQTVLDGQSPAGVNFTLTLYKDAAAAKAVFDKKNPKTTALVENGVIDFRGNPSIFAGAPPAKISQSERSAIKKCIDSTRASG
jgi:hypothetical protein